ncbi:MAG: hypothetical protein KatS3mg051_0314 [Anaerolineae bacterium]|nr:MAG: hypothetical protein KatS3mg051_0314 [Anaerolineae bacterium]
MWHQILSPQVAELTGYPLSRFNEDWGFWLSLIHPDDRARLAAFAAERTDSQAELEYRLLPGRWRDHLGCAIASTGGSIRPQGTCTSTGW